jgi:hypothetical protein
MFFGAAARLMRARAEEETCGMTLSFAAAAKRPAGDSSVFSLVEGHAH